MIFYKAKEITDLIIKQSEKVKECLKIVRETVVSYLQENPEDSASLGIKAKGMKKDIDYIRDHIIDHLYQGALIPVLREDIFDLVNGLNKLAIIAIGCNSMFLDQRPEIPSNVNKPLSKMVFTATGTAEPLHNCILACIKGVQKPDNIRKDVQEVRKIFTDVYTAKSDLIREISFSSIDHWNKVQLYLCLNSIAAISEEAVKVSEEIETILLQLLI